MQVAEAGAQAATKAKGSYNTSYGEEFVGWVPIVWGAREYAEALEAGGQPGGSPVRETPSGQLIVSVFPRGCGLPVITIRPLPVACVSGSCRSAGMSCMPQPGDDDSLLSCRLLLAECSCQLS